MGRARTSSAGDQQELEVSEARLKKIIYQNSENHFLIARFVSNEDHYEFTGKGYLSHPQTDMNYTLEGSFRVDPKWGKQFDFKRATLMLPEKKDAVISLLSSNRFEGIGRKTAEKIYDELGEDAFDQIAADPNILVSRCHLAEAKKDVIVQGLSDMGAMTDSFVRLIQMGLSDRQSAQVLSNYSDVNRMLQDDCFDPLYSIPSFPYEAALKLADGIQMPPNDLRRLAAALFAEANNRSFNSGSTWISREELYKAYRNIPVQEIDQAIALLQGRKALHLEEDRIYTHDFYAEEWEIANLLAEHMFPVQKIDPKVLDEEIEKIEKKENISYDPRQKEAIELFFEVSMMILNGGPGTGKSTTVKGILQMIRHFFPDAKIQLCAPTGRASKRLASLSDADSKTIHSLLKWDMDRNVFQVLEEEGLDCDFLILDEFSMVDTHVFASLLEALPARCRILLIGDEDQLESVAEGKVFNDIVETGLIPQVSLTTLFRTSSGSGIARLAREIRENEPFTYSDGVEFLELNQEQIVEKVRELARDSDTPADFQVLAPQYQRGAGINLINTALQDELNPFSPAKSQIQYRDTAFREGDRIIQLKNRTEENIFNGDIGTIVDIDSSEKVAEAEFDDANITFQGREITENIRHAWCISVHKAQGSEYREVCVIADPAHSFMLTKRLLYTAISRAKRKLYILGNREAFEKGCRRVTTSKRRTTLQERMKEAFAREQKRSRHHKPGSTSLEANQKTSRAA